MHCLVRVQVTYLHGTGIENIETVMNFYILRKDIWVGSSGEGNFLLLYVSTENVLKVGREVVQKSPKTYLHKVYMPPYEECVLT